MTGLSSVEGLVGVNSKCGVQSKRRRDDLVDDLTDDLVEVLVNDFVDGLVSDLVDDCSDGLVDDIAAWWPR